MNTTSNTANTRALIVLALITLTCAMSCTVATVPCATADANCNPAAALLYVVDAETTAAEVIPDDQFAAGYNHTCALLVTAGGLVRCWGEGANGKLGYANTDTIGDDETPLSAGDVDVGGTVVELAAGSEHTCALLDTGTVRCWGEGANGKLGYANTNTIGDDETPASAGDVDIGGTVTAIAAGGDHTCALLETGSIRCWGRGFAGRLGYANTNDIGDDETPASAGDVNVGGTVTAIAAGDQHTCAQLSTGPIRCWGQGSFGRLGYGNSNLIGDDETPASAGDINVGGTATSFSATGPHTCALFSGGNIRCWGQGVFGQLGYGNTNPIGDDETPASAGDVPVGGNVTTILAGGVNTCAILENGNLRCWGDGSNGQPGYGNTNNIGDNETPASVGDVDVAGSTGAAVTALTGGIRHTCARLSNDSLRCWGQGTNGALGYGNTNNIGDDEPPASAGDVVYK